MTPGEIGLGLRHAGVVPLVLVAAKLLTSPNSERWAKDRADLEALRDRNLVDGPRVLEVLQDCAGSQAARKRLAELIRGPETSRSRSGAKARTGSRAPATRKTPRTR